MRPFVARRVHAPAEAVFAVLSDGWLYPSWVVGAARMRTISPDWPETGSRLAHSFGVWPLPLIDDDTEMVEWQPPQLAILRAKGGPLGGAGVRIEVTPALTPTGEPESCFVRISEAPVQGPTKPLRPVFTQLFRLRNIETLRRLAALAEGKAQS